MFFFFFCGLETFICGPNYSEVFYGLNVPKFTSRILKRKKEDQALKFDNEDLKLCYLQCLQILVR